MPQEFYVLRCFSCETFQVHIVKIAKKWECKMCGAKQSLKKNYGKGSAKDCRAQVMKLNELRMLKANTSGQMENESFDETLTGDIKEQETIKEKPLISKWAKYLDEIEPDEEGEVEVDFVSDMREKKKRKTNRVFDGNSKKMCHGSFTKDDVLYSEEANELSTTLNHKEHLKPDQKMNASVIQSNGLAKAKQSKYSKYLDEDESDGNNDSLGGVKKSSNIFESDSTDLDSILNF